jgi:hypothetical protein
MDLSVGNKPNAHPTSDDIERAIDERPKASDSHLHLQSNDDDSIEAFAEANGLTAARTANRMSDARSPITRGHGIHRWLRSARFQLNVGVPDT